MRLLGLVMVVPAFLLLTYCMMACFLALKASRGWAVVILWVLTAFGIGFLFWGCDKAPTRPYVEGVWENCNSDKEVCMEHCDRVFKEYCGEDKECLLAGRKECRDKGRPPSHDLYADKPSKDIVCKNKCYSDWETDKCYEKCLNQ